MNVNGLSLRGITMREVRRILTTSGPQVDIIIARDQHPAQDVPKLYKYMRLITRLALPVKQREEFIVQDGEKSFKSKDHQKLLEYEFKQSMPVEHSDWKLDDVEDETVTKMSAKNI